MNLDQHAEELTESWINGNKGHVWSRIRIQPVSNGLALAAKIADLLDAEDRRFFVSYLEAKCEETRINTDDASALEVEE